MEKRANEQVAKLRLLYTAKILYEETDVEHFYTTNQIRQLLLDRYGIDSHRTTLPTDVEALRALGVDVKEYLATQKRYWIEDRVFTVPEIKLLIDAVNSSKFITKKKSEELQLKLSKMASNHEAEELTRNVSVEHRVKRDNEQIYQIIDAINNAINSGRKISFRYFKYDIKKKPQMRNGGQPYILSPHQLVWNGDFYYAVGVNDDKEVRIFRLDRIESAPEILEARARALPKGFSMNKFLNTTFRMFGTDYRTVTLICSNDVVDSILDRFGKSIKIDLVNDEQFRVKVDVAVSNVFYGWVFGFGGKVRIEGPVDVKEEYKLMVQAAL